MQASHSIATKPSAATSNQAWLSSARWDILFIISPAFISSVVALAFRNEFASMQSVPLWAWVCLVLLVDVAHVYATLFRTYFHSNALEKNKGLLLAVPALCWVVGSLLYSLGELFFWRVLAYLAVFHFIRQQYGFVVLYSRKDPPAFNKLRWLDCACVYMATIYPMLFWHTHMPRNFSWFVSGDFIETMPGMCADVSGIIYGAVGLAYIAKEISLFRTTGFFNVPRNLLIIGTASSWWIGIVMLNSDMAFTMTNVLSHGIPYMALVWLYHRTAQGSAGVSPSPGSAGAPPASRSRAPLLKMQTRVLSNVFLFVVFLAVLAYLEEGFWDGLIWREHLQFFMPFSILPTINDSAILAILVPLLALPQSTHYVLDGFIWRVKDKKSVWTA